MRTYLAIAMAVAGLVGLFVTGGCVSKVEYDKALAICRRTNEELVKSQEDLRITREEKDQLAVQLGESNRARKAKESEIALLESKNRDFKKAYDELSRLHSQKIELPLHPGILLPELIDTALQGFAKDNPQLVEYLPRYGMVKFKADFTFEKGSDDVSTGAAKAMGQLVRILNSSAAAKFHVYVAGHTDDIPIKRAATLRRHPTNWYLSVHRAVEVEKVLVKAGLEPARIGVVGFGEYHPIAPNKPNKKGNPKNRRVEIWIVPPDRFLTEITEAS